jgi:hypothetical protein
MGTATDQPGHRQELFHQSVYCSRLSATGRGGRAALALAVRNFLFSWIICRVLFHPSGDGQVTPLITVANKTVFRGLIWKINSVFNWLGVSEAVLPEAENSQFLEYGGVQSLMKN